jgi:hypothetical protein
LKIELTNWLFSKQRLTNLVVGISAVILYETARAYYRPFIYSTEINDFHFADTLGNTLGTVATLFIFLALLGRDQSQDHFIMRAVILSVLVYELAHPLLGKPIDPLDMVVTILAGILCEGLYWLLHRRSKITS